MSQALIGLVAELSRRLDTLERSSVTTDGGAPTKGNLLVGDGSRFVNVGVGANDQVILADSLEDAGLKWADLPSSSGSPLDLVKVGTGETYETVREAISAGHLRLIFTSDVTEVSTITEISLQGLDSKVFIHLQGFTWFFNNNVQVLEPAFTGIFQVHGSAGAKIDFIRNTSGEVFRFETTQARFIQTGDLEVYNRTASGLFTRLVDGVCSQYFMGNLLVRNLGGARHTIGSSNYLYANNIYAIGESNSVEIVNITGVGRINNLRLQGSFSTSSSLPCLRIVSIDSFSVGTLSFLDLTSRPYFYIGGCIIEAYHAPSSNSPNIDFSSYGHIMSGDLGTPTILDYNDDCSIQNCLMQFNAINWPSFADSCALINCRGNGTFDLTVDGPQAKVMHNDFIGNIVLNSNADRSRISGNHCETGDTITVNSDFCTVYGNVTDLAIVDNGTPLTNQITGNAEY